MSADPLLAAYARSQALLSSASVCQLQEALRLLACQVAYAERYREVLPLAELVERIVAPADPAAEAIATAGLDRLIEVLELLRVAPPERG